MTCWWSSANGKRVESLAPMAPHSPEMEALEPRLLLDGALVEPHIEDRLYGGVSLTFTQ